ncbi:delta-60 repeat domain-containing protein, partial [Patescibacteria group bacterium]
MKRKIMMIRFKDKKPEFKEARKIDLSELPPFIGECDFNDNVQCIIQARDGKFLIGGGFTEFNGHSANYFICLNPNGTINEEFMENIGTGFNDWVRS